MRALLGLSLAMLATIVLATDRPAIYRHVDARGNVTYPDRPERASTKVRIWAPRDPSSTEYAGALMRSESDRIYELRLQAEERRPRPIVTYLPRSPVQSSVFVDSSDNAPRARRRWDPNLPESQPPSLERRYHYDGR
jgi:hypothetical protein